MAERSGDTASNTLRASKVDSITTKNLDMKQRRVVNAAEAQDPGDYVTLGQLNTVEETASKNLLDSFKALTDSFKQSWITINYLITKVIRPAVDAVFGISFTKADGKTVVMAIDTLNSRIGVSGAVYSVNADHVILPEARFIRLQYDPTGFGGFYGDLVVWNSEASTGGLFLPLAIRADPITIGWSGGKIAFFDTDASHAVLKQILNAYSPNAQSTTYSGLPTGQAGTPYAKVSDLEGLRVAYNNLRVMCEDLRTKIQISTLVG